MPKTLEKDLAMSNTEVQTSQLLVNPSRYLKRCMKDTLL